jgi:hypothetical protein
MRFARIQTPIAVVVVAGMPHSTSRRDACVGASKYPASASAARARIIA